jgi:hypothetical protein
LLSTSQEDIEITDVAIVKPNDRQSVKIPVYIDVICPPGQHHPADTRYDLFKGGFKNYTFSCFKSSKPLLAFSFIYRNTEIAEFLEEPLI